MDFTREPIIESVITPKEGCKLVIRSSKGAGQEEFFVDAVEVVSFGNTFFLRSLEKPKSFLVPATDYEILEVRETRMVLKNVGLDRSIKIGGGREGAKRPAKAANKPQIPEPSAEQKPDPKRRERRRHYRRRRGKDSIEVKDQADAGTEEVVEKTRGRVKIPTPDTIAALEEKGIGKPITPSSSILRSLLPPPSTLISESIERYKGNELFKDVFIPKDELKEGEDSAEEPSLEIEAPDEQEAGTSQETPEEKILDTSIDLEAPEPDVPLDKPEDTVAPTPETATEGDAQNNVEQPQEKSAETEPAPAPEPEPEPEATEKAEVETEEK